MRPVRAEGHQTGIASAGVVPLRQDGGGQAKPAAAWRSAGDDATWPDVAFSGEQAAILAFFGAKEEATRRSVPRHEMVAALRALFDDRHAALRALTERRRALKTAIRQRRAAVHRADEEARRRAQPS